MSKKRFGGPIAGIKPDGLETEDVVDALSLSSDAEAESESELSDLPDETDSEAGLPSDDGETEGEGDESSDEDASSGRDELDQAFLEVVQQPEDARASELPSKRSELDHVPGSSPSAQALDDRNSDSSEDERIPRNTVGEVPLVWYKEEGHVGYTREGSKLSKKEKQQLEADVDTKDRWRTIYDEYNDEQITLSKEEIELITRIRQGRFPHVEVNPFEPEADWFTRDVEIHPLSSAPEPKRRFMPSKWEEKKIVKLVRALRKGWIKRERDIVKEPEAYLLWGDGGSTMESMATGLTYIPPTKARLPGHEESYNPPQEYLPTEAERLASEKQDDEEKPEFMPQSFDALRKVPAYDRFIKERFERCLDLYLCPRARRKRAFVKDPETLVPKLPKPQDLQPFPTTLLMQYKGHSAAVQSISVAPNGQLLASASADGSIRVWEVSTGRCLKTWELQARVKCVEWCPSPSVTILAAASGSSVLLFNTGLGTEESEAASDGLLTPPKVGESERPMCRWKACEEHRGLELVHNHPVQHISWHGRGDYFTSVAPSGSNQAVLVHQLSKKATQNPFRKNKGKVVRAAFHPTKPFFFVATQNSVRIYNLAKQELAKKLVSGSAVISSLAVHPSGDHVLVGSENNRVAWYDLDLSVKPYRSLRYHQHALRAVAFHPSYPLFASASDDGTTHVFHGMVYQDLLTNPLIVPLKVLRGHAVTDYQGVLDCAFHPTQPWLFSAGADGLVSLFTN